MRRAGQIPQGFHGSILKKLDQGIASIFQNFFAIRPPELLHPIEKQSVMEILQSGEFFRHSRFGQSTLPTLPQMSV
ncbi:MAG TPA: hypothetical protein VFY13_02440 [Luteolibacter sp.]|nr:hypothetical protein [Luteolibacter sp.]